MTEQWDIEGKMVSPIGSHPRESAHLTSENTGILKGEEEPENYSGSWIKLQKVDVPVIHIL